VGVAASVVCVVCSCATDDNDDDDDDDDDVPVIVMQMGPVQSVFRDLVGRYDSCCFISCLYA
jgi:hypothetical protein